MAELSERLVEIRHWATMNRDPTNPHWIDVDDLFAEISDLQMALGEAECRAGDNQLLHEEIARLTDENDRLERKFMKLVEAINA